METKKIMLIGDRQDQIIRKALEENKIIVIGDGHQGLITGPDGLPVVPEGMVRTVDGELIPRDKAVYLLRKSEKDPNLQLAKDGTVYYRDQKGTLHRLSEKASKRRRRSASDGAA